MVSLPKHLTVFGRVIPVQLTDLHGECVGLTTIPRFNEGMAIKVQPDVTQAQAELTLFHEACHAALTISGVGALLGEDDGREEAVVLAIEAAWQALVEAGVAGKQVSKRASKRAVSKAAKRRQRV